jgi:hypothetical protein
MFAQESEGPVQREKLSRMESERHKRHAFELRFTRVTYYYIIDRLISPKRV